MFATANSKGLRRVPAGGEAQVLTKVDVVNGETDHWWPEMSPDGTGVVFTAWNGTAEQSRIVALSLLSGPSGTLSDVLRGGSQPRFSPTGHLVYTVGGTLIAVRFSTDSLEAVGDPAPVMEGVAGTQSGAANYAIAADGSLLYVKGSAIAGVGQRTLVWVDRQGRQEAINVTPGAYTYARLSPDGTRVVLDERDQQNDIWILDLARGTRQRLTTDPGLNRGPVWTPDGDRVAFYYVEPDTIVAVPVTPGPNLTLGKPAVVVKGSYTRALVNSGRHYDVSPDGKRFLLLKDVETAGGKPAAPEIHLVQHWSEELKRLVPAK